MWWDFFFPFFIYLQCNDKALALHSRAKRHTKQKNKGTIKNGSRKRARRGLDKIGTQKQKNKGNNNEQGKGQGGGLAKNKAG